MHIVVVQYESSLKLYWHVCELTKLSVPNVSLCSHKQILFIFVQICTLQHRVFSLGFPVCNQ